MTGVQHRQCPVVRVGIETSRGSRRASVSYDHRNQGPGQAKQTSLGAGQQPQSCTRRDPCRQHVILGLVGGGGGGGLDLCCCGAP